MHAWIVSLKIYLHLKSLSQFCRVMGPQGKEDVLSLFGILKLPSRENTSHWLIWCSCIFKYLLKLCARRLCNIIDCICFTHLQCAFLNVSSNGMPEKRQSHNGCICLAFLHCVFSSVSSKRLHNRTHNHIGCICSTFLHCVFSNVSSNCLPEKMQSHIGCICLAFLHCAFSNVP